MIEQTKAKPQATLDFKMNNQLDNFSFSPPESLCEGGKRLLAITLLQATNSIFNITDENNSFSFTIPSHWNSKSAEKTSDEVNKVLKLKSQNDFECHVKQVRKKEEL